MIQDGFSSMVDFIINMEYQTLATVNQTFTDCFTDYLTSYETIKNASFLLYNNRTIDFLAFCDEERQGYECYHELEIAILLISNSDSVSQKCNLLGNRYDNTMVYNMSFKGVRSSYMSIAAFSQHVTNLGLTVLSTW